MRGIKQRFPQVHLHCYSASEILAIAEYSNLSVRDTIARLRDAGLNSIPGGGAEILDDDVRYKVARLKCLTADWLNVHRTAHELGMRTTATMMFGVGETYEQRINHLQVLHELQEETGGFTAFIPWSFQPEHTALGGRGWDEATAVDYLKVLAISRLYLVELPQRAVQLGDAGAEDLPDGPALRRQRRGFRNAGRKRGPRRHMTNCTTEGVHGDVPRERPVPAGALRRQLVRRAVKRIVDLPARPVVGRVDVLQPRRDAVDAAAVHRARWSAKPTRRHLKPPPTQRPARARRPATLPCASPLRVAREVRNPDRRRGRPGLV